MIFRPKNISKFVPPVFLILLACGFFYKFFIYKLVSIPTDITVGMYYPWLDQKWSGLTTNVPVKNPLMSDIVSIVYQWRILSINSLKSGMFPFWVKEYLSGVPLFANFQNSLINFTNISFIFIQNNGFAWTVMVLSQLVFLLLSTYFCLRVLKFQKISSIFGSITSSFSLFTLVWLEYGIHTYVAAFLPLFIICIQKYFQTSKNRFLVFLSFLVALQFYGGYPQFSIFSLIFIFFYFICFSPKPLLKNTFKFLLFISLGLLLSSPLLFPGFELISRSIRQFDVTASQDKTLGFLPFRNLLTLPIPNFWGNPTTYDYFGIGYYDNNAIFPGSIALIALLFSIINVLKHRSDKKNLFFTLSILFSFLICIKNPLSSFFKNNLGFIFSGNGISARIILIANFSFGVIVSQFIDFFILSKKNKRILPLLGLFLWQAIILIVILVQKTPNPIALKNSIYSFCLSSTIILLLIFIKKSRKKTLLLSLTLVMIIVEMFYYGLKYVPSSKPEYLFPTTPSIEFLQKNIGNYRLSTTNTIPCNMWAPYGLSSSDGYDTTMPLLNFEYFSLTQTGDFDINAKRAITYDNESSPLYQNLSIKYKMALGTDTAPTNTDIKNGFTPVFNEKSTVIKENLRVLPKIHFISQIKFASDKQDFRKISHDTDFATTAILYQSDESSINLDSNCQPGQSSINILKDQNTEIIFETKNNCSQLVFISNSFYPGWQAKIDNQSTQIYQTNHSFQSIFVPAGNHTISLNYQPTHFQIYLILASISAIILIIIIFYDLRKN